MDGKQDSYKEYIGDYNSKKDWVFPYSKVKKNSRIILYGAGDVGQSYYRQLELNDFCTVEKWVDVNYKQYQQWGLEVCGVDDIKLIEFDYIIIALSNYSIVQKIIRSMIKDGISENAIVWDCHERVTYKGNIAEERLIKPYVICAREVLSRKNISSDFSNRLISEKRESLEKCAFLAIPRLVIELTTACTLKCRYCNNLMPLYKKQKSIPLETIIRDIDKIVSVVDEIVIVELIGGEPLLYKSIDEVMTHLCKIDKVKAVDITTNGTVLPRKKVLDVMRNPKVTCRISKYQKSTNFEKLEKILFNNNINFITMNNLTWVDSGTPEKHGFGRLEIMDRFLRCSSSYYCKTLFDGKIFSCARAASMYDLGLIKNTTFVDIRNSKNLRESIRDFWLRIYDESCDYCNATDYWRSIIPGEQMV